MNTPNYQFPTEVAYKEGDRGTGAWAVAFGQDGVPESIVLTEDFESLPLDITVTDAGAAPWARSTTTPHAGSWCFKSGTIGNSQSSDAIVTVPGGGPDAVRFWYRVSSETNFDFFRVIINGATVLQASGTVGWTQATLDLNGATTVTFRYIKDSSSIGGEDASFIDDLEFIIKAIPAVPLKYVPLRLTDDGERLKVEDLAAETALDDILIELGLATASLDVIEAEIVELSHTEDASASSGDMGILALVMRHDANTGTVSADGDYSALHVNEFGQLKVSIGGQTVNIGTMPEPKDAGVPGTSDSGSTWSVFHTPAANVQATITKAAPGANKRLVVTSVVAGVGTTVLLGGPQNRIVTVLDGAATVWSQRLMSPAAAGSFTQITVPPFILVGSVNTAMTLRVDAAGGANTWQTVAMTGYVVSV